MRGEEGDVTMSCTTVKVYDYSDWDGRKSNIPSPVLRFSVRCDGCGMTLSQNGEDLFDSLLDANSAVTDLGWKQFYWPSGAIGHYCPECLEELCLSHR